MPSLGTFSDIATIQPSLQAHLVPLGAQSIIHAKTLPNPWRQSCFSKNLKFYTGHLHVRRGKVLITAVATLETKYPAQKEHEQSTSLSSASSKSSNGSVDDGEVDDREKLRRMRISKANRGNTPWNKGRKHSPETLQKIRERTKIAMQDPKIKLKLANLGHAQNKETRMKIGEGVRMRWARRKERRKVQETCHFEWQNLLAEAAKEGYTDEEELQWDSYNILDQQNQLEWLESVEQRKAAKGAKSNRRAPKSPEQRRRIAEAIAAKWADPSYRERVCSGLAKYHGIPVGVERRRRRPRSDAEPRKKNPTKKSTRDSESARQSQVQVVKVRKRKTPVYKDPLASSKLEMIKSIRAKRVAEESKKMDAVERARLLISEAEKAAKVLEIAALKSPVAQASLLESKKLIAEATQLIESLEMRQIASDEDGTYPSLLSPQHNNSLLELDSEYETKDTNDREQQAEINGTHTFLINGESLHLNMRSSDLPTFNIEGTTNQSISDKESNTSQGDREDIKLGIVPQPNGTRVHPPAESNGAISLAENHPLPNGYHGMDEKAVSLESGNVTKKWVRGRLVEVTEAA
ncbi:Nuclease associated modular domain 3 [Arabidopsis thaliana x Arabidopsis arenosa]|uniref:Nuclease associated modular domain 3 n=1 Tax=Arabidopsis thaliana x Arabidopsis arenosa TaxID=1240361 RepID=A0A8T2CJ70_9BRAS|nr:Nuclease associated modular domain 3 [Arabidopsis thaliana x Arabidopsis arenosa]